MKEVAGVLGITARTVAFHKYRMMETLGIRSTAELIQFAVRSRVVRAWTRGPDAGAWTEPEAPVTAQAGGIARWRRS